MNILPSFSVLIATRNRPDSLNLLLDSISRSTISPLEIVIVSTGNRIEESLAIFSDRLPIKHFHISGFGQIRQKIYGISVLDTRAEWILFLDDDLLLRPEAVREALNELIQRPDSHDVVGLGLSQVHHLNSTPKDVFIKLIGKYGFGQVWKSGTNVNYMRSKRVVETKWLNGVALWRVDMLKNYSFEYLESKYSICEDLIFSYNNSKVGKLLYIPYAKFDFQDHVFSHTTSQESFRASAYWRLFFVRSNPELSTRIFLFFQLYRTLAYCLRRGDDSEKFLQKALSSFRIYFDCIKIYHEKLSPLEILRSRRV
jgi:glycosyltransferase involved in cell wall biosynthesis